MTYRNRKLLNMARGQDCRVRVPEVCNGRTDTTVSAHFPAALGMGFKQPDWRIAFACSACHDFVDARTHKDVSRHTRLAYWDRGHVETMEYVFTTGIPMPPQEKPAKPISKVLAHPGYSR